MSFHLVYNLLVLQFVLGYPHLSTDLPEYKNRTKFYLIRILFAVLCWIYYNNELAERKGVTQIKLAMQTVSTAVKLWPLKHQIPTKYFEILSK